MQNHVKITTILSPLDLLAPHSCRGCGELGKPLCDCCKNYILNHYENYCPNCKTKNPTGNCKNCKNIPPTYIVGSRHELVGKLIYDLKLNSTTAIIKPLAELLDKTLPEIPGESLVVPLPTISKHIRHRGFDHTLRLAKALAQLRGKNYKVEKLLVRAKNTVQIGADAKTRQSQAASAYKLVDTARINPETTYLLLDDIWTTGSSMKAALKKLRSSGAHKIILVVLAVNRLD